MPKRQAAMRSKAKPPLKPVVGKAKGERAVSAATPAAKSAASAPAFTKLGQADRRMGMSQPAQVAHLFKQPKGKKTVLHIGCGVADPNKLHKTFRGEEWVEIRLDINADDKPDIVSDMTDMFMVPDGSVDAIFSSHNVEHLYPHLVPVAMKEFYRVLRSGGFLLVTLPDIQRVANYVSHGLLEEPIYQSAAGPISAIDIMYGYRRAMAKGNLFMAHRTGFTAKSLADKLRDQGFSNITVNRDWLDLWAVGYRYEPGDQRRVEKIMVRDVNPGNTPDKLPPLPVQQVSHPGAKITTGARTDELDMPPRHWQKLGLKK